MGMMKEGNTDVMQGNILYGTVLGPSQLLLQ